MPALAEHSGDGGIPLSLVSLNTVLFGHSGDGGILLSPVLADRRAVEGLPVDDSIRGCRKALTVSTVAS